VTRLLAVRKAKKEHLQRIVSAFDAVEHEVQATPRVALEKLIASIGSIATPSPKETSVGSWQGAGRAQSEVKARLEKLLAQRDSLSDEALRTQLLTVVTFYKKLLETL